MSEMTIELNGTTETFLSRKADITVDTSYDSYYIWMDMLFDKSNEARVDEKLSIGNIQLKLDSALISGRALHITNTTEIVPWAKFLLRRGTIADYDTSIYTGGGRNTLDITFSESRQRREIWAYIYSKIYEPRVYRIQRDTIKIDTVIETHYDTTWVNTQIHIDTVKTKVPKEFHITIEEEKRASDSLFINATLKFVY
jgi:hypothetical protein